MRARRNSVTGVPPSLPRVASPVAKVVSACKRPPIRILLPSLSLICNFPLVLILGRPLVFSATSAFISLMLPSTFSPSALVAFSSSSYSSAVILPFLTKIFKRSSMASLDAIAGTDIAANDPIKIAPSKFLKRVFLNTVVLPPLKISFLYGKDCFR